MVGLRCLNVEIGNREIEEMLIESDIVSKLVRLAKMFEHPFLQIKSIEMLINLANAFTIENLKTYFNLATIPFSLFLDTFRSSEGLINATIRLFIILNKRANFI